MKERIATQNNNFWPQEDLYKHIGELMLKYYNDAKNHFFIETAKKEKWFGWHDSRSDFGFCGFMRTNLLHQVVILNKLGNSINVPVNHSCFMFLFKSDWFQNSVLQNGFISFQEWCASGITMN